MAKPFNLTVAVNLQGPNNLAPIVSKIKKEIGSIKASVNLDIKSASVKNIADISSKLKELSRVASSTSGTITSLNKSLGDLGATISRATGNTGKISGDIQNVARSMNGAKKAVSDTSTAIEEFGKQSGLAIKRFLAFSSVSSVIYGLTNAITSAYKEFITFDKEIVRLSQVTGQSTQSLSGISKEITRLSTSLGVTSEDLLKVSTTLAQAGLSADETKTALEALAKSALAPSFDNLTDTTEGAIAAMRQFGIVASDLEGALGSINAVAAKFAVEASDIITAIQRTGGVFASASRGVSEGTDALNEFIAVFTSVRATTRESAETIATGLRTIFTRIQRGKTIDELKKLGIELRDVEGKFVGPFEAVRRLSEGLSKIDPRSAAFARISEELGGFRQIGKVIPLIQQFAVAQDALNTAQKGNKSLSADAVKAQASLAVQFEKTRQSFIALVREIADSTAFRGLVNFSLLLANSFITVARTLKPILPLLLTLGAIKIGGIASQFVSGFGKAFTGKGGGGGDGGAPRSPTGPSAGPSGDKNTPALTANTSALTQLTSAVNNLISRLGTGNVPKFARGGVVPGSGNGDTVPAMLEPGEFVIRKKAVEAIGSDKLHQMNKYASGGIVNITAKELKNRSSGSKIVKDLIIDNADKSLYQSGKAINMMDNISFNRKVYKLNKPDLIDDWSGFEAAVEQKTGGTRSSIGKNDPNFPIDIINSNYGPLEVRNRVKSTSNRTLLDKLIRYYISSKQFSRLKNTPSLDNIEFGNIGIVYNSAKYNPPNAKELNLGGFVQKFANGSPGGIRLSPVGRGKEGARGARSRVEIPTSEGAFKRFADWAREIQSEYDADPSLVQATSMGMRMPPEIALANMLISEEVFTRGGSGLSAGKKFVRTPREQIVPELMPYLVPDPSDPNEMGFYEDDLRPFQRAKTKTMTAAQSQRLDKAQALKAQEARMAAYTSAESAISEFVKTGVLNIDPSIMSHIQNAISNPDSLVGTSLDSDEIDTFKRKLTKPNLDAFAQLTGPNKVPVGVQGQRTALARVFNLALQTYGSDDIDQMAGRFITKQLSEIQERNLGGMIQKFMAGGVSESTGVGSIAEDLIARIARVGGPEYVRGVVKVSQINDAIRKSGTDISSRGLLNANTLRSRSDIDKLSPVITPLLEQAEAQFAIDEEERKKFAFLQTQGDQAFKFGLATVFPIGEDSKSIVKELPGKDGKKHITQILIRGLSAKYEGIINKRMQELKDLPSNAAQEMANLDIFGTGGPLAFDFDETLVMGADIPGKNPDDYNDLMKVQEALKNADLTPLGQELSRRLTEYPELLTSIRILTARPQSNAPLLASKLANLGLPIPESKITGVSGGLNKVNNLSELETLIDDNLENLASVRAGGKRAIGYAIPQGYDPDLASAVKNQKVMEGYVAEELLRNLGAPLKSEDSDPNRPIDYPGGLGIAAEKWGLPPNIPTDVKREKNDSAITRVWNQAKKYLEKFALGGPVKLYHGSNSGEDDLALKYFQEKGVLSDIAEGYGQGAGFYVWTDKDSAKQHAELLMNPGNMVTGALQGGKRMIVELTEQLDPKNWDLDYEMQAADVMDFVYKNFENLAPLLAKSQGVDLGGGIKDFSLRKKYEEYVDPNDNQIMRKVGIGFTEKDKAKETVISNVLGNIRSAEIIGKLVSALRMGDPTVTDAFEEQFFSSLKPGQALKYVGLSPLMPSNIETFAQGGSTSSEDTVPALLTPGEFVINRKAAKAIGYAKLNRMNQADKIKGFNKGGSVGIQRFFDGGGVGDGSPLPSSKELADIIEKNKKAIEELDKTIQAQTLQEKQKTTQRNELVDKRKAQLAVGDIAGAESTQSLIEAKQKQIDETKAKISQAKKEQEKAKTTVSETQQPLLQAEARESEAAINEFRDKEKEASKTISRFVLGLSVAGSVVVSKFVELANTTELAKAEIAQGLLGGLQGLSDGILKARATISTLKEQGIDVPGGVSGAITATSAIAGTLGGGLKAYTSRNLENLGKQNEMSFSKFESRKQDLETDKTSGAGSEEIIKSSEELNKAYQELVATVILTKDSFDISERLDNFASSVLSVADASITWGSAIASAIAATGEIKQLFSAGGTFASIGSGISTTLTSLGVSATAATLGVAALGAVVIIIIAAVMAYNMSLKKSSENLNKLADASFEAAKSSKALSLSNKQYRDITLSQFERLRKQLEPQKARASGGIDPLAATLGQTGKTAVSSEFGRQFDFNELNSILTSQILALIGNKTGRNLQDETLSADLITDLGISVTAFQEIVNNAKKSLEGGINAAYQELDGDAIFARMKTSGVDMSSFSTDWGYANQDFKRMVVEEARGKKIESKLSVDLLGRSTKAVNEAVSSLVTSLQLLSSRTKAITSDLKLSIQDINTNVEGMGGSTTLTAPISYQRNIDILSNPEGYNERDVRAASASVVGALRPKGIFQAGSRESQAVQMSDQVSGVLDQSIQNAQAFRRGIPNLLDQIKKFGEEGKPATSDEIRSALESMQITIPGANPKQQDEFRGRLATLISEKSGNQVITEESLKQLSEDFNKLSDEALKEVLGTSKEVAETLLDFRNALNQTIEASVKYSQTSQELIREARTSAIESEVAKKSALGMETVTLADQLAGFGAEMFTFAQQSGAASPMATDLIARREQLVTKLRGPVDPTTGLRTGGLADLPETEMKKDQVLELRNTVNSLETLNKGIDRLRNSQDIQTKALDEATRQQERARIAGQTLEQLMVSAANDPEAAKELMRLRDSFQKIMTGRGDITALGDVEKLRQYVNNLGSKEGITAFESNVANLRGTLMDIGGVSPQDKAMAMAVTDTTLNNPNIREPISVYDQLTTEQNAIRSYLSDVAMTQADTVMAQNAAVIEDFRVRLSNALKDIYMEQLGIKDVIKSPDSPVTRSLSQKSQDASKNYEKFRTDAVKDLGFYLSLTSKQASSPEVRAKASNLAGQLSAGNISLEDAVAASKSFVADDVAYSKDVKGNDDGAGLEYRAGGQLRGGLGSNKFPRRTISPFAPAEQLKSTFMSKDMKTTAKFPEFLAEIESKAQSLGQSVKVAQENLQTDLEMRQVQARTNLEATRGGTSLSPLTPSADEYPKDEAPLLRENAAIAQQVAQSPLTTQQPGIPQSAVQQRLVAPTNAGPVAPVITNPVAPVLNGYSPLGFSARTTPSAQFQQPVGPGQTANAQRAALPQEFDSITNTVNLLSKNVIPELVKPIEMFKGAAEVFIKDLYKFNEEGGIRGPKIPDSVKMEIGFSENLTVDASDRTNKLLDEIRSVVSDTVVDVIRDELELLMLRGESRRRP